MKTENTYIVGGHLSGHRGAELGLLRADGGAVTGVGCAIGGHRVDLRVDLGQHVSAVEDLGVGVKQRMVVVRAMSIRS